MTKACCILILTFTLWVTGSCFIEPEYIPQNVQLKYETISEQPNYSTQENHFKKQENWPPKPYFIVKRYIKQTLMPSIHNLPAEPIQNINPIKTLKVLEASSADSNRAKSDIKYSTSSSSKYDSNNWTPLQYSLGINRYSIIHKYPQIEEYPLTIQKNHSPTSTSLLSLQEPYRRIMKSPEIHIEKIQYKDTPTKYIEKVVYQGIPPEREHIPIHETIHQQTIPYVPHEISEDENEKLDPVIVKLPFSKLSKISKYPKIPVDSIGTLYRKLTCQQYQPKNDEELIGYNSEENEKNKNFIYMFKNKFPH